jgi:adenylate kinase family enzyme
VDKELRAGAAGDTLSPPGRGDIPAAGLGAGPAAALCADGPTGCENRLPAGAAAVLWSAIVRRVSVVGTSGSGKSMLAGRLAAALGLPYVELDGVFHQPGWQPRPVEEFRAIITIRAAEDSWVIDGNYSAVQPIVWARADTVVWLDLAKGTVMRQVAWRTIRRAVTRQELWNGNREPLSNFLSWDPQKSVISWAWHNHAKNRARYGGAPANPGNAHLTFVHLTSHRDADRFLADPRGYASRAR